MRIEAALRPDYQVKGPVAASTVASVRQLMAVADQLSCALRVGWRRDRRAAEELVHGFCSGGENRAQFSPVNHLGRPGVGVAVWVPIIHPCWSGSMPVFVEDAAEAVVSADVQVRDLLRVGYRFGERAQGCRSLEGPVGPVLVVEVLELPQRMQEVALVPDEVRSMSSRRQVCTQRSMIEFILGIWTPLSTTVMPASLKTVSNRLGNLPSRSRIKNRARLAGADYSSMLVSGCGRVLAQRRGTASHRAAASRPDGILPGGPGRVSFGCLLLIGLYPLVDFVPVGAVVADGGLDQAERDLEVACGLGGVAIVVAYGRDDFPDVFAGSDEPGAPACRSVGEPDERVLVHPQALFHVPLRQGARGQVRALRVSAETRDRGIVQADAQRMIDVIHCTTGRNRQ
jgi:hypothetical protein